MDGATIDGATIDGAMIEPATVGRRTVVLVIFPSSSPNTVTPQGSRVVEKSSYDEMNERKRKNKRNKGAPGAEKNAGNKKRVSNGPHHASVRSPTSSSKQRRPTSILASFKQKLQGSKFRWLNEQLYTSTSQSSCCLMERNPEYFDQYHAGYREQTKSWPVRPVDRAIQWLKRCAVVPN